MTTIIDEKGMGEMRVGDKTTVLHGTFENVALFEKHSGGIYAMLHRIGTNDIHVTDLVNIIWCFSYDRDTEGWKKDDIMRAVFSAPPQQIIATVGGFLNVLFTPPATDEDDTKKKTAPLKAD